VGSMGEKGKNIDVRNRKVFASSQWAQCALLLLLLFVVVFFGP